MEHLLLTCVAKTENAYPPSALELASVKVSRDNLQLLVTHSHIPTSHLQSVYSPHSQTTHLSHSFSASALFLNTKHLFLLLHSSVIFGNRRGTTATR